MCQCRGCVETPVRSLESTSIHCHIATSPESRASGGSGATAAAMSATHLETPCRIISCSACGSAHGSMENCTSLRDSLPSPAVSPAAPGGGTGSDGAAAAGEVSVAGEALPAAWQQTARWWVAAAITASVRAASNRQSKSLKASWSSCARNSPLRHWRDKLSHTAEAVSGTRCSMPVRTVFSRDFAAFTSAFESGGRTANLPPTNEVATSGGRQLHLPNTCGHKAASPKLSIGAHCCC